MAADAKTGTRRQLAPFPPTVPSSQTPLTRPNDWISRDAAPLDPDAGDFYLGLPRCRFQEAVCEVRYPEPSPSPEWS